MLRTTIRTSRDAPRISAPRGGIARMPSAATSTVVMALPNEHSRRIHHHEAGGQPGQDRHGREPLDDRTAAGKLLRQLIEDLPDRARAESQAEHGDRAGVDAVSYTHLTL